MKFKTVNSEKQGTPYSDAVELGDLIQFSGMLGADENGIVEGGLEAEVDQIFANLKSGLDHYNLDFSNVVKCLVLLKSMDEFEVFNNAYLKHFTKPYPTRSAFAVLDLFCAVILVFTLLVLQILEFWICLRCTCFDLCAECLC